ncbi:hypothetical protein [Mycolicibacterium llatzerense]|uniref:hypothetical protein n=1 Tax=Mycolicibacterium llatzerense TaxID=280871 RepID=UPI0013A6C43E|nr:hypothetical protein [Mycolicibacterium llatzerense]
MGFTRAGSSGMGRGAGTGIGGGAGAAESAAAIRSGPPSAASINAVAIRLAIERPIDAFE